MKSFLTALLVLTSTILLGQERKTNQSSTGEYVLEKATLSVYNAQQNSLIKTYPVTQDEQYEGWMYYNNLFTQVVYANEKISECTLLNGQKYKITDEYDLEAIEDRSLPDFMSDKQEDLSQLYGGGRVSDYTSKVENGKLILESVFAFSLPNVAYSCKGVLKLVMAKQEPESSPE